MLSESYFSSLDLVQAVNALHCRFRIWGNRFRGSTPVTKVLLKAQPQLPVLFHNNTVSGKIFYITDYNH